MGKIDNEILYSLDDVSIIPSSCSTIEHRNECNPFYEDGLLPLFTAPMSSVIDINNYKHFLNNYINPILPRTVSIETRMRKVGEIWCAFSLNEFESFFIKTTATCNKKMMVLIDIANGHMKKLFDLIKTAKQKYGNNISIMAGNVANPETYGILCDYGADYIRLSVGCGNSCITSTNTGIHYPMASLIEKCRTIYENRTLKGLRTAFIIADGGMRSYSDIIKSIALGAHYVMCGSIFNKAIESCAKTYVKDSKGYSYRHGEEVSSNDSVLLSLFKEKKITLYKEFYGMSTKKAQIELGNSKLKTGEGRIITQEVEYTLSGWVENFIDYIRSAMSYTSSYNLKDFQTNSILNIISNKSIELIKK